ncbi:MAG: CrcB family protein [Dehalococcoidia bacterium]
MPVVIAIASGGAFGSLLRYWLSTWVTQETRFGGTGTMAVNLIGAFGLGLFLGVIQSRFTAIPRPVAAGIGVGVFGGFTTFSSFMWDVVEHVEAGRVFAAAGMVLLTVVLGLAAMIAGLAAGRAA